ncbi:MAG: hypothetical protein K2J95_10030, partial [Lachnospiraceae bacterium]|nr:hypothetical protein [Lachnospiraceae bacterium]
MCDALVDVENEKREKVLIYGLGNFYLQNEKDLNKRYSIISFIDNFKRDVFEEEERNIILVNEITKYKYDKIIIMV